MDTKSKLPLSHFDCMWITNLYFLYSGCRGIILILITLTQIDFMILKIVVDVILELYISYNYIYKRDITLMEELSP